MVNNPTIIKPILLNKENILAYIKEYSSNLKEYLKFYITDSSIDAFGYLLDYENKIYQLEDYRYIYTLSRFLLSREVISIENLLEFFKNTELENLKDILESAVVMELNLISDSLYSQSLNKLYIKDLVPKILIKVADMEVPAYKDDENIENEISRLFSEDEINGIKSFLSYLGVSFDKLSDYFIRKNNTSALIEKGLNLSILNWIINHQTSSGLKLLSENINKQYYFNLNSEGKTFDLLRESDYFPYKKLLKIYNKSDYSEETFINNSNKLLLFMNKLLKTTINYQ